MRSAPYAINGDFIPEAFLKGLFDHAVAACHPRKTLKAHLPPPPAKGRLIVIGAGKAVAAMARTVEQHYVHSLAPDRLTGLVITRLGHGQPTHLIEVREAGHPTPDQAGIDATQEMMAIANSAGPDDLVLVLLSGGGSALTPAPVPGLTLPTLQNITQALLKSGAPIQDINTVRKHLSQIQGGQLAKTIYPAPSLTLAISDVPGDDPTLIASGPTVPDPSTKADAHAILKRVGMAPPASLVETPKPHDKVFDAARYQLIATPKDCLTAAQAYASAHQIPTTVLGENMEGDVADLAHKHLCALKEAKLTKPHLFLSGGEATVSIPPKTPVGAGGPNQAFALELGYQNASASRPWVLYALAADTDGNDGGTGAPNDPAGAILTPHTLTQAKAHGLDPKEELERFNAGGFFEAVDGLLIPGPTFTNVNDLRAVLVCPHEPRSTA
ncbi:MAG: glycerate kinase [Parvibaculaceae bacterium]|nr:glycerate kinase [Parvibaculaceae bacterium]